jgi:hypothetical protein
MGPHWQSAEGSLGDWWAPGASTGAYGAVRSARRISELVVLLLALGVVVDLASIVHEVSGLSLLDRFVSGAVDEADLTAWDTLFATLGLVQVLVFLGTAVVWLVWQFRVVASVLPLGLEEPPAKPGMSIVWWFVPFANLVMVHRIYRHLLENFGGRSADTPLVGAWWGVYLLSSAVTNFAGQYWERSPNTAEAFQSGLVYWIIADAMTIASAVLAVLLVRRIQAGQDSAIASAAEGLMPRLGDRWQGTAPGWQPTPLSSGPLGGYAPTGGAPLDGPPPARPGGS